MSSLHHLLLVDIYENFVRISIRVLDLRAKPRPSNSDQVILAPKWTFVPDVMKFPPGVPEISRSRGRVRRMDNMTTECLGP